MTDDSRDKKPNKQPKRQQSGDQSGNQDNGKGLDGEAQKHIGRMLKATYDEIAHEPVPDKFLALLKQLEFLGARQAMTVSPELRDELLAAVPGLRAFALSLTGNVDIADDLVQETLVKAWTNFDTFQQGTNLRAWLFTILRNHFYSEMRKKKREVEDADGSLSAGLSVHPEQDGHMDMEDFKRALLELPDDQREALVLVGGSGFAYEEAAEICGVAVGTIKSRVSRARGKLAQVLDMNPPPELGPDATPEAIFAVGGGRR